MCHQKVVNDSEKITRKARTSKKETPSTLCFSGTQGKWEKEPLSNSIFIQGVITKLKTMEDSEMTLKHCFN